MKLLIKIIIAAAVLGPVILIGEKLAIILVTPLVALIFTSDLMNLVSASVRAMRKHAYDSDLRVFNYGYTQIRMIMYRNRAWFSAKAVCEALGYSEVQKAVRHYATTEYCVQGKKKEAFLSESGVRRLAETSRLPDAKRFLKWFDTEVVASLEKGRRRLKSESDEAGADSGAPTGKTSTRKP